VSDEPEVVTDNVIQVRIQPVHYPIQGIFKVVPESEVDAFFDSEYWHGLSEIETTRCGNAFQILNHHRVSRDGLLEAWWVTVTPVF
jgi:hypothetical protein